MKCTYKVHDPRLLLEAGAGQLFTSLGPHLVECVCAVRSHDTEFGTQLDVPNHDRLSPDAMLPVIVIACRVEVGEPEYFPPGYQTHLHASTPIVFLEQIEPLAMRAREVRGEPAGDSARQAAGYWRLNLAEEWTLGTAARL